MGCTPKRSCYTNTSSTAQSPNPSPEMWGLLDLIQYDNAYVMKVRYLGCTNYEGVKVMVYTGKYEHREYLDPHFSEDYHSPVARFRPNALGWALANELAGKL